MTTSNPFITLVAKKLSRPDIHEVDQVARSIAMAFETKTVRNYMLITYTPLKFWREQVKPIAISLLAAFVYVLVPFWLMTLLSLFLIVSVAIVALINFREFERRLFQALIFVPIFGTYMLRAFQGIYLWFINGRQ